MKYDKVDAVLRVADEDHDREDNNELDDVGREKMMIAG